MREVNVNFANVRTTGTTVNVAQRAADVTVQWRDDAGQSHSDTTTELFPNILSELTVSELRALANTLVYAVKRRRLGLDSDLQVTL